MEHEVLGTTIDTNLNFYSHLKQLCKTVANKLNALTRIISYLDKKQKTLLYNSFFKGHLSYCPLIWTFCPRRSNNLINKLRLGLANENTLHINIIHILMTEIYKFLNGLSLPIMGEIFLKKDWPYSLRNQDN